MDAGIAACSWHFFIGGTPFLKKGIFKKNFPENFRVFMGVNNTLQRNV
jgi:hypothetical protein